MRARDKTKIAATALLTVAILVLAILLFAEGQALIASLFALAAVWCCCESIRQYNEAKYREWMRDRGAP